MAKVTLLRGKKGANMFRKFKVFIDDQYVAKIKRGETLDFELSPGLHKFYCRIDWEGSNELLINVPETGVSLEVHSKGARESAVRSLVPLDGRDKYLVLLQVN